MSTFLQRVILITLAVGAGVVAALVPGAAVVATHASVLFLGWAMPLASEPVKP